jgi:tRNA(Ile)-lysidine synthase
MLLGVKKTIRQYRMFEPGQTVVVGVSGGPDSTALFLLLSELKASMGLELVVAHLDHRLRKTSGQDAAFVKALAGRHGASFYTSRIPLKALKAKGSLEDRMRCFRYAFYADICRRVGASRIALGHTLDDQAETVLMRVLRGSGLFGLSAILPRRVLEDGVDVVRPLINTTKRDVLAYLKKKRVRYRVDETNTDQAFLRNKVRQHLLPLLERKYNPNIKETLAHLASTVGADYRYLWQEAERFLRDKATCRDRCVFLPLEPLCDLDVSLCRIVFRLGLERVKGDLRKWELRHAEEIEDLMLFRPKGSQVHLPDGVIVAKTENALKIFKR